MGTAFVYVLYICLVTSLLDQVPHYMCKPQKLYNSFLSYHKEIDKPSLLTVLLKP